jgi:hypothetical protein
LGWFAKPARQGWPTAVVPDPNHGNAMHLMMTLTSVTTVAVMQI